MPAVSDIRVPWNASWSGESRYEIRPCRYADGQLAMWQNHALGTGRPLFAEPHMVRQRRSVWETICTVCGQKTPRDDRWWFCLGEITGEGYFATTEAPMHRVCADHALSLCPRLRAQGRAPVRFPPRADVVGAKLRGGEAFVKDYGFDLPEGRLVIGSMKFAWELADIVKYMPRDLLKVAVFR